MNLEARGVTYSYAPERRAIDSIDLTIGSGEITFVIGKNGSGKSTLFSCLAGTRIPDSGTITVDGADLGAIVPRDRARLISVVAQTVDAGLSYTAIESVLLGRIPYRSVTSGPSSDDLAIAEQALGSVGLLHLADRPVSEMSGGERQLVRIARGICQQTPLLIMDEPGAHLDPANRERVLDLVGQLARNGTSFILSSHDPNEALRYATSVLVLRDGALVDAGEPVSVLTPETIAAAFGLRTVRVEADIDTGPTLVATRPPRIAAESIAERDGFLGRIAGEGGHTDGGALVIVTGLQRTGKTTWCRSFIDVAREAGYAVSGLLAPAVFDGRHKIAIDQVDVGSGETRRLAERVRSTRGRWEFGNGDPRHAWVFHDDTIAWANSVLEAEARGDIDLLVIDEIGPLELSRGEGFSSALALISSRRYRLAVVVVRSSLVPAALERWPWAIPIHTAGDVAE
jgi:iron complex transport system ATP-binding protein